MSKKNRAAEIRAGVPRIAALGFAGLLSVSIASIGGCITINIYFPAAAAEKAADRIIDDVLSGGKGADTLAAPAK